MRSRPPCSGQFVFAAAVFCLLAGTAAAMPPFRQERIAAAGRTVAAEIGDFDGDGRGDLLQILYRGRPPREERVIRLYAQQPDGTLPAEPSLEKPLPAGAAAYDVMQHKSGAAELVLLRQRDMAVVSVAAGGSTRLLPLPGGSSTGAAADERGLERIEMVYYELAGEPRLLAIQLSEISVLAADGTLLGRLESGGLANYLVPTRPGLLFFESDVRLLFDAPRLSVADVDGDGRADIVTSTRHELRVFLQKADGTFAAAPTRVYPLQLISERDHIRASGGVTAQVADLTGDGRADLILSHQSGGMTDARLTTRIYRNAADGWQIDTPDRILDAQGAIGSEFALDLDGDGRPALVRVVVPFSTMGLVRTLLTRTIQAEAHIHAPDPQTGFAGEPQVVIELDVPFSFDTLRASGFLPQWRVDVNGDGHRDLLLSGGGKHLDVHLGGPRFGYAKRRGRVDLPTQGVLRSGDFDGDGLPDLVLFDPFTTDAPLWLLRNLGTLPGSPSRIAPAP